MYYHSEVIASNKYQLSTVFVSLPKYTLHIPISSNQRHYFYIENNLCVYYVTCQFLKIPRIFCILSFFVFLIRYKKRQANKK